MTPEEKAAIRKRADRYLEHAQPFDSAPDTEWTAASEDVLTLLAEVERLEAENRKDRTYLSRKEVEAKPRWISVEERMPEPGQRVLVFDRIERPYILTGAYFTHDGFGTARNEDWTVTHWMPLPEPPK
jgi:hypothetical protein